MAKPPMPKMPAPKSPKGKKPKNKAKGKNPFAKGKKPAPGMNPGPASFPPMLGM